MLIAIATLITILLLGSASDYYFIETLEKGVKQEVVDKSRKKELNSMFSEYKKTTKKYHKVQKEYFKDLDELLQSRYTTTEDFENWSTSMDSITSHHQLYAFKIRQSVSEHLSEDEW